MSTTDTTKQNDLEAKFCELLGAKPKFVYTRLKALGHENVCSRCCGTGRFGPMIVMGGRCFLCGGVGFRSFPLTDALLEQVAKQVEAGELKPYLEKIRLKKEHAKLSDRMFDFWTALPLQAKMRGTKHWSEAFEARMEFLNLEPGKMCEKRGDSLEIHSTMNTLFCGLLDTFNKLSADDHVGIAALLARFEEVKVQAVELSERGMEMTKSEGWWSKIGH